MVNIIDGLKTLVSMVLAGMTGDAGDGAVFLGWLALVIVWQCH